MKTIQKKRLRIRIELYYWEMLLAKNIDNVGTDTRRLQEVYRLPKVEVVLIEFIIVS